MFIYGRREPGDRAEEHEVSHFDLQMGSGDPLLSIDEAV
jgi:hypothetical protein